MKKIIVLSLLSFSILNAMDVNSSTWKINEELAADIQTPAEMLFEIDRRTKNPFVKKALANNPKYQKLIENEARIKILNSRKDFDNDIDEIKNKFNLINENLKKILYVYKVNSEKELTLKKILAKRFNNMKSNFKAELKTELERINVEYSALISNTQSEIGKISRKLEQQNAAFNNQLVDYIKLERKKSLFKTEDILKETSLIKNNIIKVRNYLGNIEKKIYGIIQDSKFKELKDTINPELIVIKNIYDKQIKTIEDNLRKVFKTKTKLLFLVENTTIQKSEKEKYLKVLKMNKKLLEEKINKELSLNIQIMKIKAKKSILELDARFTEQQHHTEIEINELNLKLNEILIVYKKLSDENKKMSTQMSEFNKIINSLNSTRKIISRKDYQTQKEGRSFKNSIERKMKIALNKATPIEILIKYSKNLDWRVREAVAKNVSTPIEILKDLEVDSNLFVSISATNTLKKIENFKEATKILNSRPVFDFINE